GASMLGARALPAITCPSAVMPPMDPCRPALVGPGRVVTRPLRQYAGRFVAERPATVPDALTARAVKPASRCTDPVFRFQRSDTTSAGPGSPLPARSSTPVAQSPAADRTVAPAAPPGRGIVVTVPSGA